MAVIAKRCPKVGVNFLTANMDVSKDQSGHNSIAHSQIYPLFIVKVRVCVVDISQKQIDAWNSYKLPTYEPGLPEVMEECRGRNLFFSTDLTTEIQNADMTFISVNTPTKTRGFGAGRAANVKNCELCARTIAEVSKTGKIVVDKSTVPVRTAEAVRTVLKCNEKGLEFQVLSNPEFLAEGTAVDDLMEQSRILIGGQQVSFFSSLE